MLSDNLLRSGSIEIKFRTILQVKVGVESGVVLIDRHSLFRHYLNMDVITCNKILSL